MLLPLCCGLA